MRNQYGVDVITRYLVGVVFVGGMLGGVGVWATGHPIVGAAISTASATVLPTIWVLRPRE
jgi:hypothetical protein